MAKKERKLSFGSVIPTHQELQQAEAERVEQEKVRELEASLKEIRNTTFFLEKELSKKFRVYCLNKDISASQMINVFVDNILKNEVDEIFHTANIESASNTDHKVTYYIERGMLNNLKTLAINNDTTIRELLTYHIMKELSLL